MVHIYYSGTASLFICTLFCTAGSVLLVLAINIDKPVIEVNLIFNISHEHISLHSNGKERTSRVLNFSSSELLNAIYIKRTREKLKFTAALLQ